MYCSILEFYLSKNFLFFSKLNIAAHLFTSNGITKHQGRVQSSKNWKKQDNMWRHWCRLKWFSYIEIKNYFDEQKVPNPKFSNQEKHTIWTLLLEVNQNPDIGVIRHSFFSPTALNNWWSIFHDDGWHNALSLNLNKLPINRSKSNASFHQIIQNAWLVGRKRTNLKLTIKTKEHTSNLDIILQQ